jgi:hypothetical protein
VVIALRCVYPELAATSRVARPNNVDNIDDTSSAARIRQAGALSANERADVEQLMIGALPLIIAQDVLAIGSARRG